MRRRALAVALAHSIAVPAIAHASGDAAPAAPTPSAAPSASESDGWPDLSEFLNERYGFIPIVYPITEPAVGYGAAVAVAFISSPLGAARAGLGRPNITIVGGMGTENGSWGLFAADMRYWLADRLQTLAGFAYATVNLDFHGLGKNSLLADDPLGYQLGPTGGGLQARYRIGETLLWAGLRYAFAITSVSFETLALPGVPLDYDDSSRVGGLSGVVSYDCRDNILTPLRGTYLEASLGAFGKAFGGEAEFERAGLVALQYVPLPFRLFLGLRGDASASFGSAPFYLQPFVSLRGVPLMRYQGEEVAQAEVELRWQFWQRFSLVGFAGGGVAWNDFEKLDDTQGVVSGGGGVRYELARDYGLHMGIDLAFSRDTSAVYLQVGSAWGRP